MCSLIEMPIANIGEVPCDCRSCSHHRADQMRSPAPPLSSFKIAVAGRSATFSRLKNVRIHSQAHRASRFAPFKASCLKNLVQAFALSFVLDCLGSRHDHGANFWINMVSFCNPGSSSQILKTRICTRTDEDAID